MIRIHLWRGMDGTPERLTVTGHAGRGTFGEDIVCAAASALVETLMIGLTRVVREKPEGHVDPGDADLRFALPMTVEARAVVETMIAGLSDLAQSEPKAVRFDDEARV